MTHPLHPHHQVFEEDLVEGEGEPEIEEEESLSVLIAGGEDSSSCEKISWKFKLQLVCDPLILRLRKNWFVLLLFVIIASLVVVIIIQQVVGTGGRSDHSSKPPPPPKDERPPNKHHPYPSYHQSPLRPPFQIEICLTNQKECWTPRDMKPTFRSFEPPPLGTYPRNNLTRYTGTHTWTSKGITIQGALQMMLGDQTLVFESFLMSQLQRTLLRRPPLEPFQWGVRTEFINRDGTRNSLAVEQGILDAIRLSEILLNVWKRDHPKGEEITQSSVASISKRLLSLFSTERRLKEFLDSLFKERRFVSNQPIDMIYSSVFPNLAAFYGDEVVVLQPEGNGIERRSLDLNYFEWGYQHHLEEFDKPVVEADLGEFVTPGWIEPEAILGYQFFAHQHYHNRSKVGRLEYAVHKVEVPSLSHPLIIVLNGTRENGELGYGIEKVGENFVFLASDWPSVPVHYPPPPRPLEPLEIPNTIGFVCVGSSSTEPEFCECAEPIPASVFRQFGGNTPGEFSGEKMKKLLISVASARIQFGKEERSLCFVPLT